MGNKSVEAEQDFCSLRDYKNTLAQSEGDNIRVIFIFTMVLLITKVNLIEH